VIRRVPATVAIVASFWLAGPVSAQTARATGIVRDLDGHPIKGATIRATNPDAVPPQIVSTSDTKGRWAILGMKIGTYTFTVDAPGYLPVKAEAPVRTAAAAPLLFALARDPGPVPGALPSNIQAQLSAAHMLRDQGRLDQALSAYQEIRAKNPKLTSVNMVIATTYRKKAAQERDVAGRRTALERAIESYSEVLKADPDNDAAKTELAAARAEAAALR
jgi:tetratricopeptide (TPR) repeat protein